MIQCIKLCSLLLAGASALLAQNFSHPKTLSCALGDLSTAEGLQTRVSMQAAVASSTCPGPPPPPPPSGGWTFVQDGYWSNYGAASGPGGTNCFTWTSSCTINLAQPVMPGDLLIYLPLVYTGGVPVTIASVSQEPMQTCFSCQLTNGNAIQLGMAYTLVARGGEQQITCNFSTPVSGYIACGVVEAHWSGSSVNFDTGGASLRACGLKCPGIGLNLSGSDDFILQVDFPINTNPLSVSSPYNFFQGSYAYLADAKSGAAPTWFLPMSDPATSNNAIAFTGR